MEAQSSTSAFDPTNDFCFRSPICNVALSLEHLPRRARSLFKDLYSTAGRENRRALRTTRETKTNIPALKINYYRIHGLRPSPPNLPEHNTQRYELGKSTNQKHLTSTFSALRLGGCISASKFCGFCRFFASF